MFLLFVFQNVCCFKALKLISTLLLFVSAARAVEFSSVSPRLERVLERSMMVCLLGLLRTERLAKEMSAVTRVMDILEETCGTATFRSREKGGRREEDQPLLFPTYLPSNLCFRKSKSAFCIMSVTWR